MSSTIRAAGFVNSVEADPSAGDLYLCGDNYYGIYKLAVDGSYTMFAGSGSNGRADGTGNAASFSANMAQISYCSFDANFYISDFGNNIIRQMSKTAVVKTIAGGTSAGSSDGVGTNALLNSPTGVACNPNTGDVLIGDYNNNVLRLFTYSSRTVTLFAGQLNSHGRVDGQGTNARFSYIQSIAFNPVDSNFYVGDWEYNVIRKVTMQGVVTTFAGGSTSSSNQDGIGTFAYLVGPRGVAFDSTTGNMIVTDADNFKIRSIDMSTRMVSTIAGSGVYGSANGLGTFSQVTASHFYLLNYISYFLCTSYIPWTAKFNRSLFLFYDLIRPL